MREQIESLMIRLAFRILRRALQNDPGYAWGWHCNLAMSIYDESRPSCYCDLATGNHYVTCAVVTRRAKGITEPPLGHAFCNNAAARFMKLCFGVDTSKEPSSAN